MVSSSFRWDITPTAQISPALTTYEERLIQGIFTVAQMFEGKLEAYARGNAPWGDRTGAARSGLRSLAVRAGLGVTLYLMHSVHYGVYLELGTYKMAPLPVIMPTLQAHYGPIMSALRALVGG